MDKNYTISTRIMKPAHEVYQAVVSGDQVIKYFADAVSGDLKAGQEISWHWNEWGAYPVKVKQLVENTLIELTLNSREWKKTREDDYEVLITMEFESLEDGSTLLIISESGWKTDAEGLKGSHDNCGGWQHMALCLKAYLEHGIDLRSVTPPSTRGKRVTSSHLT